MSQPAELQTVPTETVLPPRWIAPWLALLAPLYVISPISLLALPQLKKLPLAARYVLAFYALSQQLPALFSPEPLLASVLALVRTLLMFGLVGVGVMLGESGRLRAMALGLMLVYLTALVSSFLAGSDFINTRLTHPYMTPITLGFAGSLGVWLAVLSRGRLSWRLPLGLLGLGILLLSGSRGPLLAALIGLTAGLGVRYGKRLVLPGIALAVALAAVVVIGDLSSSQILRRLSSADTTGRDIIWSSTASVIRSAPLSGVGSYLLGNRLAPPDQDCQLWAPSNGASRACPELVRRLGRPWLIAHNVTLQQLAETGPLGTVGLFLLLGTVAASALSSGDGLSRAVVAGLLISTVSDNTLLVPSPFFAEVFWVTAGVCLNRLQWHLPLISVSATVLLVGLSLPIIITALLTTHPVLSLGLINTPTKFSQLNTYSAFMQVVAPPGRYRAVLQSCAASCATVTILPFQVEADGHSAVLRLAGGLRPQPWQRVQLLLYPGRSNWSYHPLLRSEWTVQRVP